MSQITNDLTFANSDEARNIVDRAANSADKLLEATRQTANAALDTVADKVHGARDRVSPALDRLTSPIDALAARTRESPLQSLLMAAATGAAVMALISLIRSGR